MFERWFRFRRYRYENTRQYLRLPAAWPIKCEPIENPSERHVTTTKDISAGGVAIVLPARLPVWIYVRLYIHVPVLNRILQAEGQVVRCAPWRRGVGFELGIRFTRITPQDRADLDDAVRRFSGPMDPAKQPKIWWRRIGVVMLLLSSSSAWAVERGPERSPIEVDTAKLSREAPESASLWDFLKERTQIGYGFDEVINDNLFLRDNNKVEEYISTLEAEVFFSDPRGALLYGLDYEVNAFRYHRNNKNAIDHDVRAFVSLDPGGRYRYALDYKMKTRNGLVFGVDQIDVIRRSTDFQRQVEHTWTSKLTYALNDTNNFVPSASYSLFDDQVKEDAQSDRKALKLAADIDHDLKPGWTLFGGYGVDGIRIPGNKVKSSTAHNLRLGTKYELTEIVDLDFLFTFGRIKFDSGQSDNVYGIAGKWAYKAGPRTTLALGYTDQQLTSFAAGRLKFHSTAPSGEIAYELTKLTKLNLKAALEQQRSSGQDVLSGTAATTTKSQRYTLGAGLLWQMREKTKVTVDYSFSRSKTADYTNQLVTVGMEGTF